MPLDNSMAKHANGSQSVHRASLYVLGPLRLLDPEGRDCTPTSTLLQALLAVLALSPHGKRTRAKLQDMFFGEIDALHSGQNLRQTILRLKRSLAASRLDIVEIDANAVRLKLEAVDVDVLRYSEDCSGASEVRRAFGQELPEILEGLNLRSSCREEFEDWLRQERQRWWDLLEGILEAETIEPAADRRPQVAARPAQFVASTGAQDLAVGLLPSAIQNAAPQLLFLADGFIESVATALRDVMLAEIYDYRDSSGLFAPRDAGPGPPVLLRVKAHEDGSRVVLTLVAYQCSEAKLLWTWSIELPRDDASGFEAMRFVNEAVDRVCETLVKLASGASGGTPYHVLNLMFRFDSASLALARSTLERAYEEGGDSVHLSLLAYLNSFRVGEHWLSYDDAVRDETKRLVDAVLESTPFNSLTLAMTGHACGYILHDHGLAIDLLERSTRLNASLAICWDHLALNYLYVGRLQDAQHASEMAIQLGRFSPFGFTYDATMCMICAIRGDYARAVEYGERSLARRPNFGAPLRYTAVSYAHLGEAEAARRIIRHIRSMSPDFSASWVATNRFAVVDKDATARLLVGLQKAGA